MYSYSYSKGASIGIDWLSVPSLKNMEILFASWRAKVKRPYICVCCTIFIKLFHVCKYLFMSDVDITINKLLYCIHY